MLEQIQQEVKNDLFYQQNFANDGERFVAWYLRRVLLRDPIATRDDITDGQHDKQIDAVIVDDEDSRIVIIQGKFIGEKQVDAEPLREVLSGCGFKTCRRFRRTATKSSSKNWRPSVKRWTTNTGWNLN